MKQRRLWLVITASGLVSIVLCYSITAFAFGMLPPSAIIARRYFDAVIKEDSKSAIDLVGSDWECKNVVEEDVKKDITQFGTAETRNVTIKVYYGGAGSDEGFQTATIEFEYRKSSQSEWQRGEMRLMTDSNMPGFRYLCGNLKYHGP